MGELCEGPLVDEAVATFGLSMLDGRGEFCSVWGAALGDADPDAPAGSMDDCEADAEGVPPSFARRLLRI